MSISNRKEALILFAGDVFLLIAALWLTLLVRYAELPAEGLFANHIVPFSILFFVWVVNFFIAGLYEKHTLLLKSRLPNILLNTQMINSVIAIAFFYFIPYFVITPKTNLFIYLAISSVLILGWRIFGVPALGFRKKQKAILIGSGDEMRELRDEVNENPRYSLSFVSSVDLNELSGIDFHDEVLNTIYSEGVSTIVIDLKNERVEPILPRLYNLIFSGVRFVDKYKVYEDIFDRIPLSLVGYNWFLENISSSSHMGYDTLKRAMDIGVAFVLGVASLVLYPFVYVAVKMEDGGPLFIHQERIGKGNRMIKITKFRTMSGSDAGEEVLKSPLLVTRVGTFLRKTRIDEVPQLWSVLRGDISLIGPRPEFPALVHLYEKEIPYYSIRHLIKPGLSGWAQIYHQEHPHHGVAVSETKKKLSYDLYYIKNRSILLDLKIALKTIKTLLSRVGK